jgi:serine/threonine protein kinase
MIIEPYRFLEPLGRGSFGEVWRVEVCKEGLYAGRFFAAKLSYLPADHEEVTQEMQGTIRIIAENHPHILKLLSGESSIEGRLILVMELADGSLLDRWRHYRSSGAVFPWGELLFYMRQAAEALDYLHQRDFIHGGINPGDILLLDGQVKIADPGPFIRSDRQSARVHVTNLSKAFCTAPERKRGIDHFQSDQYALAATYVWLRAGYPTLSTDAQPEELSFVNCLSQPEREVLAKALSPEPDHRYSFCLEFVEALRQTSIAPG